MSGDLLNILLAFVEGFALILSPCILPILPIILSGSFSGDRKRPIGIIIGFIIAFSVVTLFIRTITRIFHVDPEALRLTSLLLLAVLGIVMMSNYLSERFNIATQKLSRIASHKAASQEGLWGGIVFGMLVAIIWTPCAGPILAAVIVQVVLQQTTLTSVLSVIAFAIGVAIPMFLIAVLGRSLLDKFKIFKTQGEAIRKILGALIIISVVILYYDPTFGVGGETVTDNKNIPGNQLLKGIPAPFPAPAISGISAWINSPPLTIQQLHGKVVLIDFWTYSCINCIRTLPYLKAWYEKYRPYGFEIIGVHSPEFAFEHELANVQTAVKKFGIKYPVALDNNFVTWRNYFNRYWPAHYLINAQGEVVYIHFGEGAYDVTENNIRFLLGLGRMQIQAQKSQLTGSQTTPEIYLGYLRIANFASPEGARRNVSMRYSFPKNLPNNAWALQGDWIIAAEKSIALSKQSAIRLHFNARHVYAVMGSTKGKATLIVNFNGIQQKQIVVTSNQLYDLLNLPEHRNGLLELIVMDPGLEIYTFTFG